MLPTDAEIQEYLDRLFASEALGRSKRKLALIEYLIRAEVRGEGETLKAYAIGLDVFDKPEDFDPRGDSSIRVEIGRLRQSIALFEASEDATTALCVEIPVGTYRPVITKREIEPSPVAAAPASVKTAAEPFGRTGLAKVVAVAFFAAIFLWGFNKVPEIYTAWMAPSNEDTIVLVVENFEGDALGSKVAAIVKDSFTNSSIVTLLDSPVRKPSDGHFTFRGDVTAHTDYALVNAELVDLPRNKIVWNHVFRIEDIENVQREVSQKLNGELETRLFGAAKVLLEQRDLQSLTPAQLFVLGTWVSGPAKSTLDWETERVRLMQMALDKDPDFGPAHSVLADKYGFLANVHPTWDTAENLALSKFHASRASALSPLDANVMFNVAQSYWHAGWHGESQRAFVRVTELDPGNSLAQFFARVVPYWCAPVPDDVMAWALDFDQRLSRDDPIRWIVLTWIATLQTNRGEYEAALTSVTDAARIFQVGYTFMSHAMLLNKLGEPDAAFEIIANQNQTEKWPGITAAHYAQSTIPRLCREQKFPDKFIADYAALTDAVPLLASE